MNILSGARPAFHYEIPDCIVGPELAASQFCVDRTTNAILHCTHLFETERSEWARLRCPRTSVA